MTSMDLLETKTSMGVPTHSFIGGLFVKNQEEMKRQILKKKQNAYKKSIKDYTKAIQLNPNLAEACNNRGIVYKNKGDYGEAIKDFDRAISLNPNDDVAYNNLGLVYIDKTDYEEAIKNFDRAISLNPNSGHCLLQSRASLHLQRWL